MISCLSVDSLTSSIESYSSKSAAASGWGKKKDSGATMSSESLGFLPPLSAAASARRTLSGPNSNLRDNQRTILLGGCYTYSIRKKQSRAIT